MIATSKPNNLLVSGGYSTVVEAYIQTVWRRGSFFVSSCHLTSYFDVVCQTKLAFVK